VSSDLCGLGSGFADSFTNGFAGHFVSSDLCGFIGGFADCFTNGFAGHFVGSNLCGFGSGFADCLTNSLASHLVSSDLCSLGSGFADCLTNGFAGHFVSGDLVDDDVVENIASPKMSRGSWPAESQADARFPPLRVRQLSGVDVTFRGVGGSTAVGQ
jgi:hypothetical protein